MGHKAALLIDGGYLRKIAVAAGNEYNPDFIERVAHSCFLENEEIYRVFYYDAPRYKGTVNRPISEREWKFQANNRWLEQIGKRDYFAVRLGKLTFRGWKLKRIPENGESLTDDHFSPDLQQKGVDMRIGLDIASLKEHGVVSRFIMLAFDADLIPAMKVGRRAGMQAVAIELPKQTISREFRAHVDFTRQIDWPT